MFERGEFSNEVEAEKYSRTPKRKNKGAKYISYNKVGEANLRYINRELIKIYNGVNNGIADGIAFEKDGKVYVTDSGKDNGKLTFGVRKIISIKNESLRREYVKKAYDKAISNGYVSDELSGEIGYRLGFGRGSDLRRELGSELQTDTGKSEYQQIGVLGENADQRGLREKYSRESGLIDYINQIRLKQSQASI